MNVEDRTIWQFAAGDADRDYVDLLIKWDVIALGPGDIGDWPGCRSVLQERGSSNKVGDFRALYERMDPGDLVVLRLRTSEAYGVGEVVGTPERRELFGDVDGWDLQHTRRVRWLWTYDEDSVSFDTHTFTRGRTACKLDDEEVEQWIETLDFNGEEERSLTELPESDGEKVEPQDIGRHLFNHGVSADAISTLVDQIDDLNRIARWYGRADNPSESETIAYLVVPLMRALGWTPQKMAIEWKNIDVALFDKLPRDGSNLIAAVEAKKWQRSCLSARSQAEKYAKELAGETCERLIVTDGARYGVFLIQDDGSYPKTPDAYLNLARMRDRHPLLECDGAKKALLLMSADWRP